MKTFLRFLIIGFLLGTTSARAEDKAALDRDIDAALHQLIETTPAAKAIMKQAKAALVFPNIVKAGFIAGVQHGQGGLAKRKVGGGYYVSDYYSVTAASYGLQAGVQSFGYVMLLMSDAAVQHIETSNNWELGSGPTIVILDQGKAKTLSTETLKDDVYAFTFGQEGLMAGMGLQGSKITKLH